MLKHLITLFLALSSVVWAEKPTESKPTKKVEQKILVKLPDGTPAKNIAINISTFPNFQHYNETDFSKYSTTTDEQGYLSIQLKNKKILFKQALHSQSFIFDVKGYALHIQAYHPMKELQLTTDNGFHGVLLDTDKKPFKNRKVCVGQSIGIIWGSIHIPPNTNSTTTDENGKFTMRQMILNSSSGRCTAAIEFPEEQNHNLYSGQEHTFSSKDVEAINPIVVTKVRNKLKGNWKSTTSSQNLAITPSKISITSNKKTTKASYKISKKENNHLHLQIYFEGKSGESFLGYTIPHRDNATEQHSSHRLSLVVTVDGDNKLLIEAGSSNEEKTVYSYTRL